MHVMAAETETSDSRCYNTKRPESAATTRSPRPGSHSEIRAPLQDSGSVQQMTKKSTKKANRKRNRNAATGSTSKPRDDDPAEQQQHAPSLAPNGEALTNKPSTSSQQRQALPIVPERTQAPPVARPNIKTLALGCWIEHDPIAQPEPRTSAIHAWWRNLQVSQSNGYRLWQLRILRYWNHTTDETRAVEDLLSSREPPPQQTQVTPPLRRPNPPQRPYSAPPLLDPETVEG